MSSLRARDLTVLALAALVAIACAGAPPAEEAGQEPAGRAVDEPAEEEVEEPTEEPARPADQLAAAVEAARSDLARRLSLPAEEIEVNRAERVTWRDSSAGCPEPGMIYMQMLTPGLLIELRAAGRAYRYHAVAGAEPFLCERPSSVAPLPAEPVQ